MRRLALLIGAGLLWSTATAAQPGHDHGHDHGHAHGPAGGEKRLVPPPDKRNPSRRQVERRIKRIQERAAQREKTAKQRAADRRKAVRRRLMRVLRGRKLTPDMIGKLRDHAKRTARLRQMRLRAAEADDYRYVMVVDRVLARINARHERWLRDEQKKSRASAGKSDAGAVQ